MLAGGAGLAGLLLASLLVQGVVALSPANVPADDARIDTTVLVFALGLSLVSTALFGLVPALHASRLDLSNALKQGGSKATASRAGARLRSVLVVAEVALSVILLATAGLLVRSFLALQRLTSGSRRTVCWWHTEYAVRDDVTEDLWTRSRFYADVLDRLRTCLASALRRAWPTWGWGESPGHLATSIFKAGQRGDRASGRKRRCAITADYFKTLEIPLRAGRDFDRTDTPERPRVAIVNETLARTAFPGESPIGQRIQTGTNRKAAWMEIVGVVGDTRWQDPSQPARAVIYAASTQGAGNSLSILARTSLDSQSLAGTLRTLLHDANPTVPVKFETMDELFDSALAYPRFRTQVIGLFASVAVVLAAVGIFSVLAYWWGSAHGELRSAGPWAPGPSMSSPSSLVKGCGWSRSALFWDWRVRSPWRG